MCPSSLKDYSPSLISPDLNIFFVREYAYIARETPTLVSLVGSLNIEGHYLHAYNKILHLPSRPQDSGSHSENLLQERDEINQCKGARTNAERDMGPDKRPVQYSSQGVLEQL